MKRFGNIIVLTAVFGSLFVASAGGAADASVAELLGKLKSPEQATQIGAIDELGALGTEAAEAVDALTGLLKDASPVVRAHAALALGDIGAPAKSAAPALIELLADPDGTVRRQAVDALVSIRPGPQAGAPLFVKLMTDADAGVQMRVLNAIADAGSDAVPAMVEALKNDAVAYWACLVLREIGPDAAAAVPALTDRLADPKPEVRREALLALAAIGKSAAPAVPKIAALVDDKAMGTAATFALACIGQIPADVEAKIRANGASDDPLLSTTSLWALSLVHPDDAALRKQASERLVQRLADDNPTIRAAAARALASLPPAPEIMGPIMEKALENADAATIQNALDALATLGAPAVPRLTAGLKHERLRAQIAYVLGQIGPEAASATDALVGLLEDEDPDVAGQAALALGNIGPGAKAAVPALIAQLDDPACPIAPSVAFALGKMGPEAASAAPALAKLAGGTDELVSVIGAWAVVQVRGVSAETAAEVVPVLSARLGGTLPLTRQLAAEALGDLGPLAKDALPALTKAASDEDANVRAAATAAAAAVRGQ